MEDHVTGTFGNDTKVDDIQTNCAPTDQPLHNYAQSFPQHWLGSIADDMISKFGFRRFQTSQLLNIRFLEGEIAELDRQIYKAGLNLNPSALRFGQVIIGEQVPAANEVITKENVLTLRRLLKEYNEAIIAFNHIMLMEKVSMADSDWLTNNQTYLSHEEAYLTRLVRIDQRASSSFDPLRSRIHLLLRALWFRGREDRLTASQPSLAENVDPIKGRRKTSQNTTRLADILARFLVAVFAGILLIVPLVILNFQSSQTDHLITVSICIIAFALFVSLSSRASNQETMVAAAGYAAVLAVFVTSSNTPLQQ